jgi:serine/threonine protein kinase
LVENELVIINQISAEVNSMILEMLVTNKVKLNLIGEGAFFKVYGISDDLVLKVSKSKRDGVTALLDLQGTPLIPKLYAYSQCRKYIVTQRIRGVNLFIYSLSSPFCLIDFDKKLYERDVKKFFSVVIKKGWTPIDLHSGNLMVGVDGKVWIVDSESFTKNGEKKNLINDKKEIISYGEKVINARAQFERISFIADSHAYLIKDSYLKSYASIWSTM